MPNRTDTRPRSADRNHPPLRWWITAVLAIAAVLLLDSCSQQAVKPPPAPASPFADTNGITAMEAAQSVVVTHDLAVTNGATLADALRDIERHHKPADGAGRTFAILEAFNGAIQADGKMRVSLRLSSEKPGLAAITHRRTGEALWKSRIIPAAKPPSFTGQNLRIIFDAGDGKTFNVDGSMNPPSILDAMLKEAGLPVAQAWPDGEVRDLVFIYSACGCPIHVKCRRVGDRTERTEAATQVIFPDDPAVLPIISRLMRW